MTNRTKQNRRTNPLIKFHARAIAPNAKALAEVMATGDIAVLVHEPGAPGQNAARMLGWDGVTPVFAMSGAARSLMLMGCKAQADHVTARWLSEDREHGRILVLADEGTALLNFYPGKGFAFESGSEAPRATA